MLLTNLARASACLTDNFFLIIFSANNSELLADKIIKKKLSVRQAEALARLVKSNKSSIKSKDPNSIDIENQLSSKIGMKVFLNNKKNNTGTLIFEYKGVDQLDRLIKIIKENY